MSDDWRLRVDFQEPGNAAAMRDRLEATDLEHELADAFRDRIVVSSDGPEVFCYAATREQAERAGELIRSLAADRGWQVETELMHWHPAAEDWEDPDTPLPAGAAAQAAEHAALIERERAESQASGHPEFEVRIECRSHRDAVELGDRLEAQGIPVARRWRYLVVGANDEDSAGALAQRIREQAPPGTVIISEGTPRTVTEGSPGNPFAIFGGLGG
jgi:hypothetical protein